MATTGLPYDSGAPGSRVEYPYESNPSLWWELHHFPCIDRFSTEFTRLSLHREGFKTTTPRPPKDQTDERAKHDYKTVIAFADFDIGTCELMSIHSMGNTTGFENIVLSETEHHMRKWTCKKISVPLGLEDEFEKTLTMPFTWYKQRGYSCVTTTMKERFRKWLFPDRQSSKMMEKFL